MAQTDALVDTLKQVLKQHKLTYADVGRSLDMSEANVKRQFASRRFTLDRLEAICQIMNMELTDLFALYDESRQRMSQLSYAQEQELVNDVKLLLVAVSVRNRLTFEDILSNFQLTDTECIRYLAQLDRLKIIDLLPNNRIKLRIAEDFRWLPDGPIERFFESQLQGQFLKSHFTGDNTTRLFLFGLLSDASVQMLLNKIQTLEKEFTELLRRDAGLPYKKRQSVGCMLAMRPWDAKIFKPLLR
jgi:hypothetical protein